MAAMLMMLAAEAQVRPTVLGDKHAMLKVKQGEKFLLLPVQESEDIAAIAVLNGQNDMVQRINVKLAIDRVDYYVPYELKDASLLDIEFHGDRRQKGAVGEFVCCTMIPLPNTMDIRGWAETNPLNGPAWSLQWEYIANILYALVIRRLSKVALGICVAIFAVMTIILCLNIDVTGFLEERNWASYTVVGGWSTTPDQLQVGLTRLLYPFFCGLLISRIGKLIKVRGGFWWCSLMIIILFCMPWTIILRSIGVV